jgi:Family of unknown function (DUF5681)
MIQQEQIQKKRGNPNWTKGQSANPAGRPLGSRNKIAENVLTAFSLTTGEDAEASLRELRANDPGKFWQIAASLLPREVAVSMQQALPGNLDPQSFATLKRVIELIEALAPAADPQNVFETLERALVAAYSPDAPAGSPAPPRAITHQPGIPLPMAMDAIEHAPVIATLPPPPYLQNS